MSVGPSPGNTGKPGEPAHDVTTPELGALLRRGAAGDRAAMDEAFSALYDELSVAARGQRARWQGTDTLSTTVLVHEAYLKLVRSDRDESGAQWDGRAHFFALAARVMRQVLVNYAEARQAAKRGGDATAVPLDAVESLLADEGAHDSPEEILALDAALARLAAAHPRQAQVVECRFFAGLSIPETAEVLGTSPATVKRDWQEASAWLYRELGSAS
jgi:RNA polymerase sigma factor (TIGR02999 family)